MQSGFQDLHESFHPQPEVLLRPPGSIKYESPLLFQLYLKGPFEIKLNLFILKPLACKQGLEQRKVSLYEK